jgi:hypothetical protein
VGVQVGSDVKDIFEILVYEFLHGTIHKGYL